ASPATRDAVRALLSDRATYATLGQDLLARAFAWQPGDFTDDAERHLHAFRDAFLADEPDAGGDADARRT
ncbi:nucleotidyltransferase, partial [Burkholderia multivorans]